MNATQTRAAMADRALNPLSTVSPAVGRNTGGRHVDLSLMFQGVQIKAEDIYDAIAAQYDTQASLTTALTGANNDLVLTSRRGGENGKNTTIRYVDPAANSQSLGIVVAGTAITVNLATSAGGAITSTAASIRDALNGDAAASALLFAANAPANDGTGVVTALAVTPLAGNAGKVFTDKDTVAHRTYQLRITP